MPGPAYTINVVAHRLFGSTYRSAADARVDRMGGILGDSSAGLLPRPMVVPEPDYDHGTTRSEADVQALFSRDSAYRYPDDLTLNDIFQPLSVRFELLRVVDDPIDSDLADFAPQSALHGIARQHNIGHVLNVYFIRDIDGAYGLAKTFSRHPSYPTYAFVSDRLEDIPGYVTPPEYRFAPSLITMAHELGHVLGLCHMPGQVNLMYEWGTNSDSLIFEPPQIRIARHQARLMLADQRLLDMREIDRGLPRVRLDPDWLF
jgi:hypothetical protein